MDFASQPLYFGFQVFVQAFKLGTIHSHAVMLHLRQHWHQRHFHIREKIRHALFCQGIREWFAQPRHSQSFLGCLLHGQFSFAQSRLGFFQRELSVRLLGRGQNLAGVFAQKPL